ncbi:MAG: hypothetical protein HZB38_05570 [Planctomycetes bacterium]|nr:hypothetical protein [Planctomycetota bacterium]
MPGRRCAGAWSIDVTNGDTSRGGATLDTAADLTFDDTGKVDLTASRISGSEVAFYRLGFLDAGDQVDVDVRASSGDLDPVAAIFDANDDVFAFNDDRVPDASDLNPKITAVAREGGEYFLGVTPFPGAGTSGQYRVVVRITRGVGVPQALGQVVYFNWAGGQNITVPNVGTFDLSPFKASDVGLPDSTTDTLKQRVEELVAQAYAGYNITFASSDDGSQPSGPHSTVNYGGFNRAAFAISEQIDTLNADQSDDTIVFTESFDGAFSRRPSTEPMAVAIANTTAHEIGHLLGLVHTKLCTDLMDTTCGNDSILAKQEFERGPLDDSVFPTGFQDSALLLAWTLGALPL